MDYYKKWNIIVGWGAFAIASLVYILTMEPTTSLWDCAEFIATSYKLEVGHPPGAPLFMMIARFFTIFASSPENVAWTVNLMSSLCGGLTVLFLFWSITHLGRRIYTKGDKTMNTSQIWTVIGAGLVGSLAYCFTDTQWFSAVEAEVYSMSSMFTAMVFWAILQWENIADKPHSDRWLILIAYLMGLSIGIHILNLLTIPALVFVYYFKKSPAVTLWGMVKATLVAGAILVAINYIIIPYTVTVGAFFDRIAVNGLGMPVNVGFAIYVLVIFAIVGWAIYYTHTRGKKLLNTILLCLSVILLGYSSYASVLIRASANPPMNSNNPNNPYALFSLLNREQYGTRPLLYGHQYSSPAVSYKSKTNYLLNQEGDRYIKEVVLVGTEYPAEFKTLLPRMWRYDRKKEYEEWVNIEGNKIPFGEEMITFPTGGENLQFLFTYQMNFMYWRYFLWNFVGRQSDIQSSGELTNGNWLSGIKFIDQMYLGPQDNLPSEMADNKGRNTYYFLPFILGIVGLIYQLNRDKRNFSVVMLLFLMMGLVLVFYFNTAPSEPRERDYVYAGSFYAFCIWIGFGVLAIRDFLLRITKREGVVIAAVATVIGCSVPAILVAQNWDDHDRSHRYVAKDIGWNYLQSTLPNSIIMNSGDNDTFPLWYNQEVEGVRLDVKIMNLSYLGGAWYIDQMTIKSNESDPVPFSLPREKYLTKNEIIPVYSVFDKPLDARHVINFIKSEHQDSKIQSYDNSLIDFVPTDKILIAVNKENVLKYGIVKPQDAELMVDSIEIKLKSKTLRRDEMMLLDLLATFDWERPLYFTQPHVLSVFEGLRDYLQFDGYAYRLVPIKTPSNSVVELGRIDSEFMYSRLMELFRYGNVSDPRVYVDSFTHNNLNSANARNAFAMLAKQLIAEGDVERAVEVLDAGIEKMPFNQVRHSYRMTMPHIEAYYMANEFGKGNEVLEQWGEVLMEYITYFNQFKGDKARAVARDINENVFYLDELLRLALAFDQQTQAAWIDAFLHKHNL